MQRRLVLASASPARRLLLEWAGLAAEVMPSDIAEDGVEVLRPAEAALVLARRKAEAVVARLSDQEPPDRPAPVVVGCDSILEFDGMAWGKALSAAQVVDRWRLMRGHTGTLHTGHAVIDTATGRDASEGDSALIRFGEPSDREIEAYSATDEALAVAGPFTLEGRSAPWIRSIDGNYGTVTGLSLPVLRDLLHRLGIEIVDLWP